LLMFSRVEEVEELWSQVDFQDIFHTTKTIIDTFNDLVPI
jgi:hypothetical protein